MWSLHLKVFSILCIDILLHFEGINIQVSKKRKIILMFVYYLHSWPFFYIIFTYSARFSAWCSHNKSVYIVKCWIFQARPLQIRQEWTKIKNKRIKIIKKPIKKKKTNSKGRFNRPLNLFLPLVFDVPMKLRIGGEH